MKFPYLVHARNLSGSRVNRCRGVGGRIGSLSNGVFERRTSTGSEVFFILKHLDAPKFVFLSVLTIIETSCPKKWAKPLSKNEKKPLPVDVRRSKTSLLKFTNDGSEKRKR